MRGRVAAVALSAGVVVLAWPTFSNLPRQEDPPASARSGAPGTSGVPECDEQVPAGLAPRFCVELPVRTAAASAVPAPATGPPAVADPCAARGYLPGFCSELPGPATGTTGRAPGIEADLVCGESGIASTSPRFCVGLPTQATIAGGPVRPGTAELERWTGVPFSTAGTASAFLFLDTTIDAAARARIAVAFSRDVAGVEDEFAHRFVRPPAVYVFAGAATFARGLTGAFGYPRSVADDLSREHGGVLLPGADAAVVNWESAGGDLTIVRHELVHAAIREIAGAGAVPPWLDEGLATASLDVGATAREQRERYAVLSLAENGRARLATLTFSGALARYDYVAAAEAADILRAELGQAGLQRVLVATGGGIPFAEAYAREARRPLAEFTNSFLTRLRERLPVPRIFTGEIAPNRDVTWTAFGFRPAGEATVAITGNDYRLVYRAPSDPFGATDGTFGSTAPPGAYTLTVDDGSRHASVGLRTTP